VQAAQDHFVHLVMEPDAVVVVEQIVRRVWEQTVVAVRMVRAVQLAQEATAQAVLIQTAHRAPEKVAVDAVDQIVPPAPEEAVLPVWTAKTVQLAQEVTVPVVMGHIAPLALDLDAKAAKE
jgi:alpha-D-ribose 1-methylphosphonate 5-phosphate C-P lyase